MERHCAQCGASVLECMGSVKAGDLDEFWRGVRPAEKVRELCGPCATFFANVRRGWRWLVRFGWVRFPLPLRRINYFVHRFTGFTVMFPQLFLRQ